MTESLEQRLLLSVNTLARAIPLDVQSDGQAVQGGSLNGSAMQLESPSTFISNDVPVTIENSRTVTSTLIITDDVPIDDLNVSLNISHPTVTDLRVFLISPAGTRVELFTDLNFAGRDLPGVILDDEADDSITSGSGTISGRFRPEGLLADFDRESTLGTWTLEITDTFFVDSGVLNTWSLNVTPATLVNISGVVFLDLNEDGTRSAIEPGLGGVEVFADIDSDGERGDEEPSAITDSTGSYTFVGLEAGTIRVIAVQPENLTPTTVTQDITAGTGRTIVAAPIGFSGSSSIQGTVFVDQNDNGVFEIEESGLSGVTVFLDRNANGRVDAGEQSTVTDGNGAYELPNLVPGVHRVSVAGNIQLVSPPDNQLFVSTALGAASTGADFAAQFRSIFNVEPNGTPETATPIAPSSLIRNALTPGDRDFFEFQLTESGRFRATVDAAGFNRLDPQLRLLSDNGAVLLTSDDAAIDNRNSELEVHLVPGVYRVEVTASNGTTGAYSLITSFEPAEPPLVPVIPNASAFGFLRESVVAGDFNGDGIADLATADTFRGGISILLGLGDGSFRDAYTMDVDRGPRFLTIVDLNDDGVLDLVSANGGLDFQESNNTVSVYIGVGNGTFSPEVRYHVGDRPRELATADFNRDGIPDLATVNVDSADVTVLIGAGDGTFELIYSISAGANPEALTAADLNGDGNPDLAVINDVSEPSSNIGAISVLLGDGTGSFSETSPVSLRSTVTSSSPSVRAGDLNQDGVIDLVTYHNSSGGVILFGIGDGTFETAVELPIGDFGQKILLEDLTGDGQLDIASVNNASGDVSIRIGAGNGTFGPEIRFPVVNEPAMLVSGDFNRDGRPDLAVANSGFLETGSISLILNRGDGVFQTTSPTRLLEKQTTSVQIADLNNDGRPEIISANQQSFDDDGSISVFAGLENSEFMFATRLDVNARSVVVGDVNRDGRLDLISVNGNDFSISNVSDTVTVHLGLGNNEFQLAGQFGVGRNPVSVVLADLDRDGILDIVTANELAGSTDTENGTLSVLIGIGDGTFRTASTLIAGIGPSSVIAEDIDNDGLLDLAVTNRGTPFRGFFAPPGEADNRVFIYWGNGDGTFEAPQIELVGNGPKELIAVDVNGNGLLQLVTVNAGVKQDSSLQNNTISILSSIGDRLFDTAVAVTVGFFPTDVVSGDFNGDSLPDLVALTEFGDSAVLLRNGDLTFSAPVSVSLGGESLQAADLNGDDVLDLAAANLTRGVISVLLGLGDGSFLMPEQLPDFAAQAGPLSADVSGDGIDDIVTLDQDGQIIVRVAREASGPLLAPPFVLNSDAPARAIAGIALDGGNGVAALSRNGRTLTVYGLDENGLPAIRQQAELPGFVSVFSIADFTGDGLDDVVGALPLDNQIVQLQNQGVNGFGTPKLIDVGAVPTVIDIFDIDDDGFQDIVITSREGGTVNVLSNDGTGNFSTSSVVRTSNDPLALSTTGSGGLGSLSRPVAQRLGDFNGDGILDLLIVNQGERSFSLLHGTGTGFTDPVRLDLSAAAAEQAVFGGSLLTRDFDQDGTVDQIVSAETDGNVINIFQVTSDLVVGSSQLLTAGSEIAGLTLKDIDADGIDDLLAATSSGDLVIFPGRDDGTFADLVQSRSTVPIAVRDLDGDGTLDVITANSGRNRVTIDFGAGSDSDVAFTDDNAEFSAPGAVELADINGDGLDDLVVANTGGNQVFLFPRLTPQSFATEPIVLFSGTNPTGISVDDVNADGRIDLVVANRGSNDVTIFLGTTTTDTGFDTGRRLAAGTGPVSAEVMLDETTGDVTSLIVTNADAGTVSMLPAVDGLGGSIFNDQAASTIPIGQTSAQGGQLIGNSFVATNPQDDSFTFIPDLQNAFLTGTGITSISSQGDEPSFTLPTDFNFDGILDLIVANSGDGRIALFAGTDIGFVFSDLLSAPGLAHPAAMDIAEINGVLNLFVTEEGEDVASIFQLRQNPGQNLPFPILFPPLAAQGNDGLGQPNNQSQSALAALTNFLLASLDLNDEQPDTAQARTRIDERLPLLTRWLQRANDALSPFISPYTGSEIAFGAATPRGAEPASDLIRSLFQTAIVTPFPIFGLLAGPLLPLSVGPDVAPDDGEIEGREDAADSAGQSDSKSSDQSVGTDEGNPADSDGSASAARTSSPREQSSQKTTHAALHRLPGQSLNHIAGFDYQRIDGAFADVASRSLFSERLFDEGVVRERLAQRRSDEATGKTSHRSQKTDHPRDQIGHFDFQQSPIRTGTAEEFGPTRESSQAGTVLTTLGLTGHYLGRAHRFRNVSQVTTERRRLHDSETC